MTEFDQKAPEAVKRVMVVDDEPLARERLKTMLLSIPEYQWVGEAGDGVAAIGLAEEYKPDLILLDIAMPGMNGMDVARHFAQREESPAIIFCTAYGDYALEAFEAAAVGYLLKPVRKEQLVNALNKASSLNRLQLLELKNSGLSSVQHKTHISIRSHRGVELLEVAMISHFVSEDKYVFAHHKDGQSILEQSLKSLEEEFEGLFLRVHRNALVSIRHIEALERSAEDSRVRLRGTDAKPQVSRRHLKELKDLMARL